MPTFGSISVDLKKLRSSMKGNVRNVLFQESSLILQEVRERSPVDTGYFRSNWKVKLSRFTSTSKLASISVYNATPDYAIFMDEGAEKFKAPWYYPQRNKLGQFKKGTGKLKEKSGRIWAGGKNPGHSKTIGGAITPAILNSQRRLKKLTNNVASAIIVEFK